MGRRSEDVGKPVCDEGKLALRTDKQQEAMDRNRTIRRGMTSDPAVTMTSDQLAVVPVYLLDSRSPRRGHGTIIILVALVRHHTPARPI